MDLSGTTKFAPGKRLLFMTRPKKIFRAFAALFLVFLIFVIYDISRRTTFPGTRTGQHGVRQESGSIDSAKRDSAKSIRR
jgi:hypothetical protein